MSQNNPPLPSESFAWGYPPTSETLYQHDQLGLAGPSSAIPAPENQLLPANQELVPLVGPARPRHRLDWDAHKTELRKLYLEDNVKLEDIRRSMMEEKSFNATSKQYKEQFKSWGWQKNLPAGVALFMVQKANERKRGPSHKDTIFEFGGMSWTKERAEASVKRARKEPTQIIDMATPAGITYQTPIAIDSTSPGMVLTPENAMEVDNPTGIEDEAISSDEWESDDADSNPLPLTFAGKTTGDLKAFFQNALISMRDGDDMEHVENMLKTVIAGYGHLLSQTHEDTSKAVYTLATFYVEHDRISEAYKIIEDSNWAHVQQLGVAHKRTRQHVMNVVELFNGWNRQDDALALLARAKEIAECGFSATRGKGRHQKNRSSTWGYADRTSNRRLLESIESTEGDIDPARFDHALAIVQAGGRAEDESVKELLLAMIRQSGSDKTPIQSLQAWTELLKLYHRAGTAKANSSHFQAAYAVFNTIMTSYPWMRPTREKFKSLKMMEASLELAAVSLKADYSEQARRIFQTAHQKACDVFGWDDERSIWMLISIGLVYQSTSGWDAAQQWFEYALSAAMSSYDEDDGIRISLEEAMEVRHFSYLNDEGRPFKTIFGVSGLRIMPTRLHLD